MPYGGRAPGLLVPCTSFPRPRPRGEAGWWAGRSAPGSVLSRASRSRTRAQKGRRGARRRSDTRCRSARRPPPRPPTPGARAGNLARRAVRAQHPGKVGSGARTCARRHPSGEGRVWGLRHLVSLSLPASSGACSPPPLPPRRGEGPLLVAAFTALNSPKGRNTSHPSTPTASSHTAKRSSVSWKKKETLLPATPPPPLLPRPHQNGRRRLGRHRY